MAIHQYTIATPHGDFQLSTPHHHSTFQSLIDFLKTHEAEISAGLGMAQIALQSVEIYLSHGRAGERIK